MTAWDAKSGRRSPGGPPPDAAANDNLRSLRKLILPLSAESLRATPPPREYLLREACSGAGVLARGKVGLFAARGGAGKSQLLIQLTVAVSTGTTWLGAGRGWAAEQGRVLLVLAEEDTAEVQRRLHYATVAAGIISDADLEQVAGNIAALPACGQGVGLTTAMVDGGELPETARAAEVRELLREAATEGRPFSLVVLDPLSRFAGADVEKDNAAATRFIQVIETFTAPEFGSPNVLLSHHRRKSSKDEDPDTADPIRGASALVDGVRWAALLDPLKRIAGAPDLLRLRVAKTNYAATPEPLMLCRPQNGHGALRVATPNEVEAYEAARPTGRGGGKGRPAAVPKEGQIETAKGLVITALTTSPNSGSGLARTLRITKEVALQACTDLASEGLIVKGGQKWTLVVDGSAKQAEPKEDGSPNRFAPAAGIGPANDNGFPSTDASSPGATGLLEANPGSLLKKR